MTTSQHRPQSSVASRGERFEGVIQVLIMLAIGAMAGAASFTHVHDVAVTHGQPDWIGWADATVVELMSLALGLELRRRARTGRPTAFVMNALVFFIACSLAAQVVEAEPSVIGWLAAALPAIGFLVLAKVVLSRTAATHTTTTAVVSSPQQPASLPSRPDPGPAPAPAASAELLPGARIIADAHREALGTPITAGILAERMHITPALAARLLTTLGHSHPDTPASSPARVNGSSVSATVGTAA